MILLCKTLFLVRRRREIFAILEGRTAISEGKNGCFVFVKPGQGNVPQTGQGNAPPKKFLPAAQSQILLSLSKVSREISRCLAKQRGVIPLDMS